MVALTDEDYLAMLQALLPPGPAWPRDDDAVLTEILHAEADELARVDQRMVNLMDEADPRLTSEMLADWERNYGLPDDCIELSSIPEDRRRRLTQKVTWKGGLSKPFFIGLLESLGYPGCTITNFKPMRANSKCNAGINQGGWRYAWRVNVPGAVTIRTMNAISPCNVPIRRWGDSSLACILAKYGPANGIVFISYGEAE